MEMQHAMAVVGMGCYALASLLAVAALLGARPRRERPALVLMAAGVLALGGALVRRGVGAGSMPAFERFESLTCYALAASGVYLLLMAYRYTRGLAAILIPYVTIVILAGISAVGMEAGAPLPVGGPWLALHVLTAYAAYGCFTLAGASAAAYLIQDGNLKHKRLGVVWERLPSLETLDQIMSRLAGLAFLLLSVAMALGFVLVRRSGYDDAWLTDPKTVATAAVWILLAVFVHLRASADRHGRGVALLALGGLLCLLFAFVGVRAATVSAHPFVQAPPGVYGP
jgi:ABC-type uncharacterized transport system permease subunit